MSFSSLRYNSLVQDEDSKIFRVSGVDTFNCKVMISADDTWYDGDTFYPIKLTEEWMEKFGFFRNGGKYYTNTDAPFFELQDHSNGKLQILKTNFYPSQRIQYVHQLQNLYFALTGEELTIK